MDRVIMVPGATINALYGQVFLGFLLPLTVIIALAIKKFLKVGNVMMGALTLVNVFIIRTLLLFILSYLPPVRQALSNAVVSTVILCVTAALLGEFGRYAVIMLCMKERRGWRDAFAFGFGYGFLEAAVQAFSSGLMNIFYAEYINAGMIGELVESLGEADASLAIQALAGEPAVTFWLNGIARALVILVHIALSVYVMSAVRRANIKRVWTAVLVYTLFSLSSELIGMYSVWAAQACMLLFAAASAYYIYKTYQIMKKDEPRPPSQPRLLRIKY